MGIRMIFLSVAAVNRRHPQETSVLQIFQTSKSRKPDGYKRSSNKGPYDHQWLFVHDPFFTFRTTFLGVAYGFTPFWGDSVQVAFDPQVEMESETKREMSWSECARCDVIRFGFLHFWENVIFRLFYKVFTIAVWQRNTSMFILLLCLFCFRSEFLFACFVSICVWFYCYFRFCFVII